MCEILRDALSQQLELPPGHWSQWNADQIKVASERLFAYYDADRSGFLDVNEMVHIMGDFGIHNRHLVLRTMYQLDQDGSGLIEPEEFDDLCRQIFWNGHRQLVIREFHRQQEIKGTQAVSASGLAKNRPLPVIDFLFLVGLLVLVIWAEQSFGRRTCDTRFDRYLWGVAILISFQLVLLLLIASAQTLGECWGCKCGGMVAQVAMTLLHVFVLAHAVAGTVLEWTSEICDQDLRSWSLMAVMMMWAAGLYVVILLLSQFATARPSAH
ncbi:unnamed protein product [Polarella glacialis]|uniref:EF-hand domain-containing protein n=1 Tax=Polarella glacialis TaxID=89957 RepID=A0A813KI77_POLGL|nr:unnamed protein product [Polarella glacialis]CAE8700644.1 unnamed protein product [Polarella glacialis]